MGNTGSAGVANRRNSNQHHYHHQSASAPPPPQPPPPDSAGNGYVFAGATPYAPQYPSPHQPPYYHYPGYYSQPPPVMPLPIPAPFDQRLQTWPGHGRYPAAPVPFVPTPLVEHQTAVVIKNLVNINKKTLRVEPDERNPGQFLVAFTFDANAAGKISIHFFAEVGFDDSSVTPTKEKLFKPATVFFFNKGLGQKFRQPSGSGITLSMFKEAELVNQGEKEVYPLVIKADASPPDAQSGNQNPTGTPNSQITESIFEKKDNGEFQVRVVKQVLWDNGKRYELEEIYGIGNSVEGDSNENDPGKECVICLSEPRDTTVLPCRHMCMCSACAKVLRFQTNRCPICRQPVESLLEIKVKHNRDHDEQILLPSGQD